MNLIELECLLAKASDLHRKEVVKLSLPMDSDDLEDWMDSHPMDDQEWIVVDYSFRSWASFPLDLNETVQLPVLNELLESVSDLSDPEWEKFVICAENECSDPDSLLSILDRLDDLIYVEGSVEDFCREEYQSFVREIERMSDHPCSIDRLPSFFRHLCCELDRYGLYLDFEAMGRDFAINSAALESRTGFVYE